MAIDSKRFPLQSAIKKIFADPKSRPELPVLEDGTSVGDDNFGKVERYDTGKLPDIALNDGNVVVEVHESQNHDTLWYHVGKVEGNKSAWRESIEYDEGIEPSVAITNDGLVVEVHQSQNRKTLWYHVGRVNGDTIDWGDSIEYDDGIRPSVAITNDGLVVEVHKSEKHDKLYYHVGRVNGDTIEWGESIQYDDGIEPSVAITNDGLVVEVHKSENHHKLYYHVGRVNGDTIEWGESIQYDDGVQPSVAITNDGLVVEVHKSQSYDTLWYHMGKVEGDKISWRNDGKSTEYGNGKVPKVACNGMLAVETHQEGSDKLLCSVLTLPAFRPNWIELPGENSYCYCACNSATKDKQRHASNNTMNVKEGAPYFYAVLTKDDDSIDFPTGAILTIQGPEVTKYDRDIEEENKLVIMSGASVRCLIVKDPKPGDWKMTMTVPEGVGFHCECNTVPSKDVYDTMTETLDNSLQKRGLGSDKSIIEWTGIALLGAFLFPEVELALIALWMAGAVGFVSYVVPGKSGDTQTVELSRDEQIQVGKAVGNSVKEASKKGGIGKAAQWVKNTASGKSKKKKKVRRYVYAVAHNGRGDFIMGFKNKFGCFFHNNGGEVKTPPGQFLNGGDDYALPGGELEEFESPIIGAWREFFEETNEKLGSYLLQPDVYEGREPPDSPEPPKYYGVYFDLGVDGFLPLFETIAEINLESGRSAAEAVSRGEFQGNYNGLRAAFPGCPPDNELKEVHMWNLRVDWQTIQGWQNDQNKSWYYYILKNLRNQLGITG